MVKLLIIFYRCLKIKDLSFRFQIIKNKVLLNLLKNYSYFKYTWHRVILIISVAFVSSVMTTALLYKKSYFFVYRFYLQYKN